MRLKGNARDTWLKLVKDQSVIDRDNCVVNNTFGVKNFEDKQKDLVKAMLDEEAIEYLKIHLQNHKKQRTMRMENYI